jgi:hypothetical protein
MNNAEYAASIYKQVLTRDQEDDMLGRLGWSMDRQSPLEISHPEGSSATGQAAALVIMEFRDHFLEYIE